MCVCVCVRERETYKFELFLVIQKKTHKYKTIQKLYFLWFPYIELFVFYTKLTHFTQKFNNKKNLILDRTHDTKLNSN